jgi:hypothetical protein
VTIQQADRPGSTNAPSERSSSADLSNPAQDPSSSGRAIDANAASRSGQARREDRARRQIESGGINSPVAADTVAAGTDLSKIASDPKQEQIGDDAAMTPQIKAAKQRSAKLLREAVDRLAWRIDES